jgi:uncharacterized protein
MGADMPATYTYPGVYIEEISSGVRTIAGVPTSVTAFVGRAAMGPIGQPVRIQNFGAFQRLFGGLNAQMPLTYSVQQYFQNGGADAVIVRLQKDATAASISIPTGTITEGRISKESRETQSVAAQDPNLKGAVITVPPNSVDHDTTLFIGPAQQVHTKQYTFVGPATIVGPDGSKFANNIQVTVPVATDELPEGKTIQDVKFLVWNQKHATLTVVLQSGSNAVAGTATLSTKTFSTVQPIVDQPTENFAAAMPPALVLTAKNPGEWSKGLRAYVDWRTRDPGDKTLFNLTIELVDLMTGSVIASESFLNLSILPSAPSYVVRVLQDDSSYVRVSGDVPGRPTPNTGGSYYPADDAGSDGTALDDLTIIGNKDSKTGLYALEDAEIFNLLVIPPLQRYESQTPDVPQPVWDEAASYCADRRAILLVDPPAKWTSAAQAVSGMNSLSSVVSPSKNAAIFWPFLRAADPLLGNRLVQFAPSGAVAGVVARTDGQVGVWKAAAGQSATLSSVAGLSYPLTDGEIGQLNPLGLNCLRPLPIVGPVTWGARTTVGADRLASEWKYVPVRRTALFIEESLFRGLQWVVFEPNDEPLWAQIRLNVGAFMQGLFLEGAFQGTMPNQAYFVRCNGETNPQINIDRGIVTVLVGFAPLKPAEFVVVQVQQLAGQAAS